MLNKTFKLKHGIFFEVPLFIPVFFKTEQFKFNLAGIHVKFGY